MSAYQLYWYPGTCARIPLVALEEISIPFQTILVNRMAGPDPSYEASVNPKGKVPALVAGGRVVTENPAIITYLARHHPEAGLLPLGDPDRELDALETMCWFSAGVHPYLTRLRFPRLFCDTPAAYPSVRAIAKDQLEQAFSILEVRLQDREWLFHAWTIVDIYMLWLWFRAAGSGMDGSKFPRCAEHAVRCESRPSVARVLDQENRELERLAEEDQLPRGLPAYQAGYSPASFPIVGVETESAV